MWLPYSQLYVVFLLEFDIFMCFSSVVISRRSRDLSALEFILSRSRSRSRDLKSLDNNSWFLVSCYVWILCQMHRRRILFVNLLLILTFEAVPSSTLMSFNAVFFNREGGVSCTLTREVILSLRSAAFKPDQCTRLFIASLGLVVSNHWSLHDSGQNWGYWYRSEIGVRWSTLIANSYSIYPMVVGSDSATYEVTDPEPEP